MSKKNKIRDVAYFTDFLGQQVVVGDRVVYATTSGRSPVQKLGVVDCIEMALDYGDKEFLRVGVREIANGRGFYRAGDRWNSETRDYERNPEPARVGYPTVGNIVRVEK